MAGASGAEDDRRTARATEDGLPARAVTAATPSASRGGEGSRQSAGGPLLERLSRALAGAAGVLLCVLALLISLDIATRQAAGFSMPWSLDVAEYLLYLITFLAAPWVLLSGGHITVDLVVARLAPHARRRADLAANAVGAAASLLLCWFACRVWWRSFRDGTLVYETFVFPEWWLFAAAPPVFLLLAAIFARRLVRPAAAGGSRAGPGPGRAADAL